FRFLWLQFLEDLPVSDAKAFRALSIENLRTKLDEQLETHTEDNMNIRRTVNRLQEDIVEVIKRELGLPISREDIIETLDWSVATQTHGYRLNPVTVVVGPFRDDMS